MRKWTLLALMLAMGSWATAEDIKPMDKPAAAPAAAPAKPMKMKKKMMKKAAAKKTATEPKMDSKMGSAETKATYQCPECKMTSDKPGKCPMCGVEMKKI